MTANDLISNLAAIGVRDPREFFLYFANHAYEARLADGSRLVDCTDFTTFLLECADAVKAENKPDPQQTCPRCYHIHEGDGECAVYLGGAGHCKCTEEPA